MIRHIAIDMLKSIFCWWLTIMRLISVGISYKIYWCSCSRFQRDSSKDSLLIFVRCKSQVGKTAVGATVRNTAMTMATLDGLMQVCARVPVIFCLISTSCCVEFEGQKNLVPAENKYLTIAFLDGLMHVCMCARAIWMYPPSFSIIMYGVHRPLVRRSSWGVLHYIIHSWYRQVTDLKYPRTKLWWFNIVPQQKGLLRKLITAVPVFICATAMLDWHFNTTKEDLTSFIFTISRNFWMGIARRRISLWNLSKRFYEAGKMQSVNVSPLAHAPYISWSDLIRVGKFWIITKTQRAGCWVLHTGLTATRGEKIQIQRVATNVPRVTVFKERT